MKCDEVRTFLTQINERAQPIAPLPPGDLDYLSLNGYVSRSTQAEYEKGVQEVARLSDLIAQVNAESAKRAQMAEALRQDEGKEHSFTFRFEGEEKKDEILTRVKAEADGVAKEDAQLNAMEANVNGLIQEKSKVDRMAAYDGGFVAVTGLGTLVLNDLNVRYYRASGQEFSDFVSETKATYAELRSIADRAAAYVDAIRPRAPTIEDVDYDDSGRVMVGAYSLLWDTGIGLAKLAGGTDEIEDRFVDSFAALEGLHSTIPNRMMAAEVMTAAKDQDVPTLAATMKMLDNEVRHQGAQKEISAGVAATIMAGRRFDGTYPLDRLAQCKKLTESYEAASILAVMNVPLEGLSSKFQFLKSKFDAWGYMTSEDTEIASAFLAIGELEVAEVQAKLEYIIEQLRNYLQYPLVAAAILASIPVFEAHEVLDLMEKAVTLLSGYTTGLERSELVAMAVRMIHGVRNELVKEIDPTAKITETPVQFTYPYRPGFFIWYHPVIIAHSYYHSTFGSMGGFHPAHSHGVGGFAG